MGNAYGRHEDLVSYCLVVALGLATAPIALASSTGT